MNNIKEYNFNVNGFNIKASYFEKNIKELFIPLLKKWTEMSRIKDDRLIIFLAAPPAVGKTTLSIFLEHLSRDTEGIEEIQAIGLDGFHFNGDYIKSHSVNIKGKDIPMSEVKGCLETFNIDKLKEKLTELEKKNIMWPVYDRNIHDVVEDNILVNKKIVLVEGNWLLADEKKWRDLSKFCNYSIFIYADEDLLKQRLIDRKMKGGLNYEEALKFVEKSDSANVRRVLNNHLKADLELVMKENGDYIRKDSRIIVEKVSSDYINDAIKLAIEVFTHEQNIPENLVPIKEEFSPIWWCVRAGGDIIAIAASWKEKSKWHWGRYAVDKRLRGRGIGKKLAMFSLKEIFNIGADEIVIEARDITLEMLKKVGCEVIGKSIDFYGEPVTPIVIKKSNFINSIN